MINTTNAGVTHGEKEKRAKKKGRGKITPW